MARLFEGIENESGVRGCADSPADDLAGAGARNGRFTMCSGHGFFLSGIGVLSGLPRTMP